MKQFLFVATLKELELPYAKVIAASPSCRVIVTGVGGTNIIHALKGLPTDAEAINVGYCASLDYPIGQYVFVHQCRLYHPNVEFNERTYEIGDIGSAICLTAGDFVTEPRNLPKGAVVDMELAYIAAFGFRRVTAIKYISDNFNLEQYCQTSSLTDSSPAPNLAGERRTSRNSDDARAQGNH